jgi:hypothetical protein
MPPTVITTDFRVSPGRERKSIPIAIVRIPLMNAFLGEGRKKSLIFKIFCHPNVI